ncbi:trypco2 family protein [Streptomyces chartreusis]|uniref:trypco2 family protein n=1 Tax=Streptomyces chartreusis TaxID=1969 RepID=UPI003669592E
MSGGTQGVAQGVGLAEAVAALRGELMAALDEGNGSRIRFRATSVQVEFEIQVQRTATAAGGVKFWVVAGDVSGTDSRSVTHRVVLDLEPVDIPVTVGGSRELLIGGAPAARPE